MASLDAAMQTREMNATMIVIAFAAYTDTPQPQPHSSDAIDGTFKKQIAPPSKRGRGRPSENDDTVEWCVAVRRYISRTYGKRVTIEDIVALAAKHMSPIAPTTLRHRVTRLTKLRWSDLGVWGVDPDCEETDYRATPPSSTVLAAAEDYISCDSGNNVRHK